MAVQTINVPIGSAIVEYGEASDLISFDITKGGITFSATTSTQEVTVDQHGDSVVKEIMKGRKCSVTVPFALHDLEKLSKVMPNSEFSTDGTDPSRKKLLVKSEAGFDMLSTAKKLVIKPTDPNATANDWITIPLAGSTTDPEYTYNNENERVANVTFKGYVDGATGVLYILGDETVA